MDEPEPRAARLEDELLRQELPQRRLVGVPVGRLHGRPERPSSWSTDTTEKSPP